MREKVVKEKQSYSRRKRLVRNTLIGWNLPQKIIRKVLNPPHKLGDVEQIIQKVKKEEPKDKAKYFLKGLNYYRQKHGKTPLYQSFLNATE